MLKPFKKGTVEDIQGLKCHIPPVGYGYHILTKKLVKVDVIKRSRKKSEQYWEPTVEPLPEWYEEGRKEELKIWKNDHNYYDNKLEAYRRNEWTRRLAGVWFYNNGKPTYITGEHYYFMKYCLLDEDYPDYIA